MMHHLLDDNSAGETFPWLLLLLLIAGFLMWLGRRLRETMPGLADGLDQLGRSVGLLTFFGIISNHLPPSIAWMPWLCCAITLLAQLVLLQDRVKHHHHYLVEENAPGLDRPRRRMMNLNPNYELIKALLGQVIAAIVVLTILHKHSIPSSVTLVLISTSVGNAAIWAGLQMRDILPNFASRFEQLGVAIVLSIFFGLISMHLPASVTWVPWLCCALSLVAALWSQI